MTVAERLPSSFRDPSGFVFKQNGSLYRQVSPSYQKQYDLLMSSGLYRRLVNEKLLVQHTEVEKLSPEMNGAYKILQPETVPFISYPYEWAFSQLKDAALCTLAIQKIALEFGMVLKDSSAFNVQFYKGKPIFIDTLSFDHYKPGEPWIAYKQFCQHFLAPLALMSYRDIRLNRMLELYIDGVPLDMAASLLPRSAWLNTALFVHLFLHSKSQQKLTDASKQKAAPKLHDSFLQGLIEHLESAIKSLKIHVQHSDWSDYYAANNNYTDQSLETKKKYVTEFLHKVQPKQVWDLGANIGLFSRIAASMNIPTVAMDLDPACVEHNYLEIMKSGEQNIVPMVMDLTTPSPGIGWANKERLSLLERGPVDMAFALALIHHLAIGNNVPMARIAEFFSKVCNALIIEFVPKSDSQVVRLLASREDIFVDYVQDCFEEEFLRYFDIDEKLPITGSERTLYLLRRRQP